MQYHRGRPPTHDVWVFGMVDVSHTPALGYMEIVPRRDAATLLPIIQNVVQPGTTIHSDEWAAYNRVQSIPGIAAHETVNHSLFFVDPVTGVHTQNIESYWPGQDPTEEDEGLPQRHVAGYLDEFMWRERYGTDILQAHGNLMRDIAILYPV